MKEGKKKEKPKDTKVERKKERKNAEIKMK